ncbi:hypothetical protein BDQ17DRAFT_1250230 [Cyathus striatus]|nr:hypothetical protein BDQ17DRAFT_1250230 [Cyathus striatus]
MVVSEPAFATTSLSYLIRPEEGVRLYQHINADPTTGKRETNMVREDKDVQIENLRGREDTVSLDTAGFQFYRRPAKHTAFTDDAGIVNEYYPESIELIKEVTGASRVVLFDHTIRRHKPGDLDDNPQNRKPVSQVHVDQTTASSIARVRRHLPPGDAESLLKRRFQIINLWRPIKHAAYDYPLAFCDYRSVDPKNDTSPVALVYPEREGETMGVSYNPDHKWKYLRGMTPDEFALIKCFDSVQDGSVAVFTPHTGFVDNTTPEGSPLRESIEIRALVFYD